MGWLRRLIRSPRVPSLGPELARCLAPADSSAAFANGLEVVLVEAHTVPKFVGELYFRSGNAVAAATDAGPCGDPTATVVRTGTARRTSRVIEEDLRRMGADLGTSAGSDTSAIGFNGLSEFAGELLGLVSELAREASFPAEDFEREQRQSGGEACASSGPRRRSWRASVCGACYLVRTRTRSISPTEQQVEAYRREQLVEFYRAYYRPSGALLIVVGDFSPAAMMAEIERIFGSWTAGDVSPAPNPPLPEVRGRRVYMVHLPESVQTQVLLGNRSITRKHPDWMRLGLANSIYGGAFNSRLVMNIREQKGYTYSPRSGVHALRQHGYFSVHAAVRRWSYKAATLTEMFYELDRMRALPVGEDELADARNYLSGVFSLGLATQEGLAGQLSNVYLQQLPEDYLEMYRERIRALTSADVLSAARAHFDSANMQIVVVGDREQVGAQAALFGEVTEYDAQGKQL